MLRCCGIGDNEEKKARNLLEMTGIPILMEFVSALGIESEWSDRVNPYCIVRLSDDDTVIHMTKPIHHDPNPIWTIKTGALCLLQLPDDFSSETDQVSSEGDNKRHHNENGRVIVEVCHGNHCLAVVTIPFRDVLDARGERKEFQLQNKLDTQDSDTAEAKNKESTLALRFRPATQEDLNFLIGFHQKIFEDDNTIKHEPAAVATDVHFKNVVRNPMCRKNRKVGKDQKVRHRVRPYPDPARLEQTLWLTREELQKEVMKPSKEWVEAGSGNMGTIFLEILGCDGLPNLDIGPGNKTDAFVGIAFEETMLRTNVVHDCLAPRWMPWCTRAFAMSVRHPASLLILAVFDYDEVNPLNNHTPVGRVVINTTNFESNTSYVLHYRLNHDAQEDDVNEWEGTSTAPWGKVQHWFLSSLRNSKSQGTIIIRLRIQWKDEKLAYKRSLTTPPPFYINVRSTKALHVLRYITKGAGDMEEPSLKSIKMYAGELFSYRHHVFYFVDVMLNILLWRGRANFGKTLNVWFPIHSIVLFASAVLAIEFPNKLPTIVLYLIAWGMLTVNYHGNRFPFPWDRCKSFFQMLLLGHSRGGEVRIEPNVGVQEANLMDTVNELKAARVEAFLTESIQVALKISSVYSKYSPGQLNLTTKEKEIHWNVVRRKLFTAAPFVTTHSVLQSMCYNVRMLKGLVSWKSYYTNRFTINCIIAGSLWLVFPVETIAIWIMRIFVWTFLGPWMKLVDVFWAHKHYRTYEELMADPVSKDRPNFDFLLESKMVQKVGRVGRLYAEEAIKRKAMREHLYGRYSKRIPSYDQSRYPSIPLKQSTAQPYCNADEAANNFSITSDRYYVDTPISEQEWQYVPDQKLEGDMIPIEASKAAVSD